MFASNPNVGISSTIQIFAFDNPYFWYFSANKYFENTINLNCCKKKCKYRIVESNNLDFIVLSKYILPEKYQKSGMLKAKIWIVEEMPTFGFDAHNNPDFYKGLKD